MIPRKVRLTPQADEDLLEISEYLYPLSEAAARRVVGDIVSAYQSLGDFPDMGHSRDDLAPGLRGWVVRNYLVLYRVEIHAVVIDRIVHGARDISAIFNPPDSNTGRD